MSTPRISVVIPVFNRAHLIQSTLDSVKTQTFVDFECLIIDDGSSDFDLLNSIVANLDDSRFRILRQSNAGGGAARNTGIESARGEWIAFLDSDDRFLPTKLAMSLESIDENDPKLIVFSKILVDRGEGIFLEKPNRAPHENERIDEYLLADRGFIQTSSIFMNRDFAREVRFSTILPFSQDTDFCIRAWLLGGRFRMLSNPMVVWKDDTLVGRVSNNKKVEKILFWIDGLRPNISSKAYWGYKGWHIAKILKDSSLLGATSLYVVAVFRGCYSPKLALSVFLQIFLSRSAYRLLANTLVKYLRIKV